ncbi:hypothetical protein L198_06154 [Cryptococcus wingfieldii CBS 7118]|uniref:WSC domain-containing protein n=1 Tax=Cryptococcus wingfieldii CBS 7118 TaxID=1295528 RepID=A0A1E3IQF1_9TREE|nr:hypothetical protein L198_06154 [Cryptococcus wingfieldii CBS 7118]ODN90837.1 hypothetical protein L198_06154 [Cryptococcus wingfieldii CBS 7118]
MLLHFLVLALALLGSVDARPRRTPNHRRSLRHLQKRLTNPSVSGWSYSGCVRDGSARALTGQNKGDASMTPALCTSWCAASNYIYAGLEANNQCYCGNSLNNSVGYSVTESECSDTCVGNTAYACGGSWRLSLYKSNSAGTWAGCYKDSGSSRTLDGVKTTSNSMTALVCNAYCSGLGYAYAGTEYYNECYCGNSLDSTRQDVDTKCQFACKGDSTQYCGGDTRLGVYALSSSSTSSSTTASTTSKASSTSSAATSTSSVAAASTSGITVVSGSTWIGCYSNSGIESAVSATKYSLSTMTVSTCISHCSGLGYSFAELQYYSECYCGSSAPATSRKNSDNTKCLYACKGDSSQTCGGAGNLGVYSIGTASTSSSASSTSTTSKATTATSTTASTTSSVAAASTSGITVVSGSTWVGCYTNSGIESAVSATKYSLSTMTVSTCISHCSGLGYSFAELQYYSECYCGSSAPATSRKNSDNSKCLYACKGDSTQTCGGAGNLGVYSIGTASTSSSASSTSTTSKATGITLVSGSTYLGCYTNSGIDSAVTATKYSTTSMTVSLCMSHCTSLGYTYAGLEYYSECYCGSTGPASSRKNSDDSKCLYACKGDSTQKCGGAGNIAIYSISASTISAATTSTSTSATVSTTSTGTAPSSSSTSGVGSNPACSSTKYVYAHHMVGNTYSYTQSIWASDIAQAYAAGIDGFALNYGSDSWQTSRIADAYAAAKAQGSFKLFLSMDVTSLSCSSAADAATLVSTVTTYASHSAAAKYENKMLLSTFAGESCTFGQGSYQAGWTYFRTLLSNAGVSVYFTPATFADTSTFSSSSWMDGEFNWDSGWPMGSTALDTSSDTTYLAALGNKEYMAAASPAFFTYYGPSSYNKNWIYRSDDWLLARRLEQIISQRVSIDLIELISWNDYGESHYLGPIRTDQPNSQGWTAGMPHTAWLTVVSYYASAFKTGSYSAGSDQLVLWSRPHPKAATPSAATNSQPTNWNYTEDNLYVWVALKSAATVSITSGSNTVSWSLAAGVSKLSVASSAGTIGASIVRSGSTVKSYSSSGSFTYTLTPTDYNFNYFVASA